MLKRAAAKPNSLQSTFQLVDTLRLVCSLLTTICGTVLDLAWSSANATSSRFLAVTAALVVFGATAGVALLAQEQVAGQVLMAPPARCTSYSQ